MTADEARESAKALSGQVANAKINRAVHPALERETIKREAKPKPLAKSFASIIPTYLAARTSLRDSSMAETTRYLNDHWKPLHSIAPAEISRGAIAVRLTEIATDSGPAAADRARSALSSFFRWAIGEGVCEENPVLRTNKRNENGSRERTLTDAEIAAVWIGAAGENGYLRT